MLKKANDNWFYSFIHSYIYKHPCDDFPLRNNQSYSPVLDSYFRNTKRDKVSFVCLTKEISVRLFFRDECFICMLVTVESPSEWLDAITKTLYFCTVYFTNKSQRFG